MGAQAVTVEYLIDLLERRSITGAAQYWFVSRELFLYLRKLRDDSGAYIYSPDIGNALSPPPLLGYPVRVDQTGTWEGIDLLCEARVTDDPVSHPKHYTSRPSGIECIQITEHMGFTLGYAVECIWRANLERDDGIEDLKKAKWCIERELQKRGAK